MKQCISCSREFKPSSRHKSCPACRRQQSRDTCACGNSKHRSSTTCIACANPAGANNGNWKGGKIYHKAGYVQRYCENHPRGRYVFEHILVMEEQLGRYLVKGETVHHKNGVRDDNRPENLELWVTFQPAGQRPEDLVAWAKEILARYE